MVESFLFLCISRHFPQYLKAFRETLMRFWEAPKLYSALFNRKMAEAIITSASGKISRVPSKEHDAENSSECTSL